MAEREEIDATIADLQKLGGELDDLAERLSYEEFDESFERLADGLREAEERIAGLVTLADGNGFLDDPSLLAVKSAWLARFERLYSLTDKAREKLGSEVELRQSRHRAADAYLKNQLS